MRYLTYCDLAVNALCKLINVMVIGVVLQCVNVECFETFTARITCGIRWGWELSVREREGLGIDTNHEIRANNTSTHHTVQAVE